MTDSCCWKTRQVITRHLDIKNASTLQLFEGSGIFFDPAPSVFVFLSHLAAGDTCPLRIPPSVAAVSPTAKWQKN